jgi:hypothetical protein
MPRTDRLWIAVGLCGLVFDALFAYIAPVIAMFVAMQQAEDSFASMNENPDVVIQPAGS